MRRQRRRSSHSNHDRWLISYADFITLLFAFFVVLYASAQVDKRKVGKLAMAIQVAFQEMGVFQASTTQVPLDDNSPMPFSTAQAIENTEHTASVARIVSRPTAALGSGSGSGSGSENGDLGQLRTELETALAAQIKLKEVAIHSEADGLVISLREVGFFESGAAQMKSASRGALDTIAAMLRQRDCRLRIEGHTDDAPIHTAQFPSNWELSTSRATEIVRLLIVRDGYSPDRLAASGYAEYHPVASNRSAEGRGMNRRVDIVILGHVPAEGPLAELAKPQAAMQAATKDSRAAIPTESSSAAKMAKPSAAVALRPTGLKTTGSNLHR